MSKLGRASALFAATLVACAFSPALSAQTVVEPSAIEPPPGFDVATEMTALYGNYDRDTSLSHFKSSDPAFYPSETFDVQVLLLSVVPGSGNSEVLLTTSAILEGDPSNFTCEACSPSIGVALFEKGVAGWVLKASQTPFPFRFGWEGDAGDASVVQFGPREYGIQLERSGMMRGVAVTMTVLFFPWNGTFVEAFDRRTMEDNTPDEGCPGRPGGAEVKSIGAPPCYAYDSTLRFVDGKDPEYYDLLVETIGTRLEDSDVVNANRTEHLRFADGEYLDR